MKKVPQDILEQIRFRSDIVDVVGSYVPLTRTGSAFKALCPFHREKTPSFQVNPARQIYHCFGCGVGGDVFRFVMEREKVDFMTAVQILARKAGIAIELTEEERRDASGKDLLYKIHEEAAALYRRVLLQDPAAAAAREYLRKRQLDAPEAEKFQIGYAPERPAMLAWGASKHYKPEVLETAGLLLRGDPARGRGSEWWDRFRNRVMFPIRDEQGRVIGFSGRVLRAEDHPAKYVNSPETPLFHKSRVLYAIDQARHAIIDARQAILCEGQIDTLRCHLAGLTNVVAAQGTAVTEEHARILKRYADEVVLMLDADAAGQNAAIRSVEALLAAGLTVRMAALPAGEDPDSLILKSGPEPIRAAVAAAESPVSFQLRVLEQRGELKGEAGRLRAMRAVLETVAKAPGAAQQEALMQQAAVRLGISLDALRRDLQTLPRRPVRAPEEEPAGGAAPEPERPADERALIETLSAYPEHIELAREFLPPGHVSDPLLRRMYALLLEHAARPGWQLAGEGGDDPAFGRLAAQLQMNPRRVLGGSESTSEKAVKDVILQLWCNELQRRRQELMMPGPGGAEAEARSLERLSLTLKLKTLSRGWDAALPVLEIGL